jgi:RNA polymerase sigma factor (sigma-70 family)
VNDGVRQEWIKGGPPVSTAAIGPIGLDPASGPPIDAITIDGPADTVVGRTEDCDIVLEHASVSRRHALIQSRESGWYVTDPGSRNGIFVNSMRIDAHEPTVLRDQDLLCIMPWTFVVRLSNGAVSPAPETPAEAGQPASRPVSTDAYATRATIFVRLAAPDTQLREFSWREFHEMYGPIIHGFARNAGLPAQERDDILQEVMLGFFNVSPQFEYDPAKGRFRGYLKRATLNAIRGRYRRHRPAAQLQDKSVSADPATDDASWDHEWSLSVLNRALQEVAGRFNPVTIEAFELYGRRGVPVEAAARRTGLSVEAVRQAKCRVMGAVRKEIDRLRKSEG